MKDKNGNDGGFSFACAGAGHPGGSALTRQMLGGLSAYTGSGGKILDIGCGDGASVNIIREFGYVPTGVDKIKGKFNDMIVCDASKLPFEDGSFDAILSECVFSVTGEDAFCEALRVLKPGGFFLVSDIYHDKPRIFDEPLLEIMEFTDRKEELRKYVVDWIWKNGKMPDICTINGTRYDMKNISYYSAICRKLKSAASPVWTQSWNLEERGDSFWTLVKE